MKYAVNINCIAAIFIPFILYTDSWRRIDRIIIHTDLTGYKETPILLDRDNSFEVVVSTSSFFKASLSYMVFTTFPGRLMNKI